MGSFAIKTNTWIVLYLWRKPLVHYRQHIEYGCYFCTMDTVMISIYLIRSTGYIFCCCLFPFCILFKIFFVFLNFQCVDLSSLWLNVFLSIFFGEGVITLNGISFELFFHADWRTLLVFSGWSSAFIATVFIHSFYYVFSFFVVGCVGISVLWNQQMLTISLLLFYTYFSYLTSLTIASNITLARNGKSEHPYSF